MLEIGWHGTCSLAADEKQQARCDAFFCRGNGVSSERGGIFLFERGRPNGVDYDISLTRHVIIEILRGIAPD